MCFLLRFIPSFTQSLAVEVMMVDIFEAVDSGRISCIRFAGSDFLKVQSNIKSLAASSVHFND